MLPRPFVLQLRREKFPFPVSCADKHQPALRAAAAEAVADGKLRRKIDTHTHTRRRKRGIANACLRAGNDPPKLRTPRSTTATMFPVSGGAKER